jgi:hypothetical protein
MAVLSSSGQSLSQILSGNVPDKFAPKSAELPEKHITVLIKGLSPGLILHNGALADESNEWTARINNLVKKAKTSSSEEVTRQLREARVIGGLYLDSEGKPVLPQHMLSAALARGATKVDMKKGKHYMSGISVRGNATLIHNGPDDVNELAQEERFQLNIGVKIGTSTVMGTRPFFREWAAELPISYESDLVDADTVTQIVAASGRFIGIGDWRPSSPKPGKYGRFVVIGMSEA